MRPRRPGQPAVARQGGSLTLLYHLGLGGDELVLRPRHERRLELGPELGLEVAAHRAAWRRLCGLEALGMRDEREQQRGGAEHGNGYLREETRAATNTARVEHGQLGECKKLENGHYL